MTTSCAITSGNPEMGFCGAHRRKHQLSEAEAAVDFDRAARFVAGCLDMGADAARRFLDSYIGHYLAHFCTDRASMEISLQEHCKNAPITPFYRSVAINTPDKKFYNAEESPYLHIKGREA